MTLHHCDAVIVACIDFRFQKYINNWVKKNFSDKTYDFIGFAGATKDLKTVTNQINISKKLHCINQVVLIHHEDCGAYGKESTPQRHSQDLKKAKKRILRSFQDLKVDLYYLHLDGEFEKVK